MLALRLCIRLGLIFPVCLAIVATRPVQPQELGAGAGTKTNLDLPYDSIGEKEEEEDSPEIVIFYNRALEGDGIFYVIDRSSSMKDGELDVAKREIVKNISEFSQDMEFGIVFFDAGVLKFPQSGTPARADPGTKALAISFVEAVAVGRGSCCQQGLVTGLQMANLSSAKRKVLVYLGDGGGTCQGAGEAQYLDQTLSTVTSMNYQRVTVNTIGILSPGKLQEDFLRRLAAQNGGTYTRIR